MLLFNLYPSVSVYQNNLYFNTSNVTIQQMLRWIKVCQQINFNTSNVTIQHNANINASKLDIFQYI